MLQIEKSDTAELNELTRSSEEKTDKDFESRQNMLGFFDLLLKIDLRINPKLYKNNNKNARYSHINNS